jgi:D-beta-D-heptose 7-phosphate kinase/D-beta-D-heptose 1-phosphate adenosyltransferase
MQLSVPRFDTVQLLVVGDIMLDRYWHGETARISPEAPVPVVRIEQEEDRPGGAANVALNIAALGAGVRVVGLVGKDEPAAVLRRSLSAAGIHCAFVETGTEPTITKLRIVSRSQQLIRLDREQRFSAIHAPAIAAEVEALLAQVSAVVISDYDKGTLSACQALIAAARAMGKPVLVDPKGTDFERYRGASLLTPNMREFEAVVGHCDGEDDLVRKGIALKDRLELDALLVTRGEHGMTLIGGGQKALHIPAQAKEIYDVTGAGDTVIATLAAAIAAGQPMAEAVALSNVAAGIVVGKLGTASVSGPELRQAVNRMRGLGRGSVSEEQLLMALEDARAAGEKIVFTNGCFDILHAGHVGYLAQARALGDRLVLAVNGDASVKRLKGEGRPVNTLERRMAVLAGLEAVDWVVSFDDDTPNALLRKVRPDILVKGGDYTIDGVVGGDFVKSYGGEVKVLSHLESVSTTAIVNAIQGSKPSS